MDECEQKEMNSIFIYQYFDISIHQNRCAHDEEVSQKVIEQQILWWCARSIIVMNVLRFPLLLLLFHGTKKSWNNSMRSLTLLMHKSAFDFTLFSANGENDRAQFFNSNQLKVVDWCVANVHKVSIHWKEAFHRTKAFLLFAVSHEPSMKEGKKMQSKA